MKQNKIDYPIAYSPMPIIENNHIVAYIVSRCYLLEEQRKFISSNEFYILYKIVYFYDQYKNKIVPCYIDGVCYNYVEANYIFDNINDCRVYVDSMNKKIIVDNIGNYNTLQEMKNYIDDMNSVFNNYYELECELLNKYDNVVDFKLTKK
ncbi:MAG: hypothetical protein IJ572_05710 [Bacilli bacterium]|nr:hypothetical protein [Bacilli bacterium]